MNNINLITPPDILYTDAINLLFVFPRKTLQNQLQQEVLTKIEDTVNIYLYDKEVYEKDHVNWLFSVFSICDYTVIDIDKTEPYLQNILGYFIAKPNTYWLTDRSNSIYNHISNNRVYDVSFLTNLGDINEK